MSSEQGATPPYQLHLCDRMCTIGGGHHTCYVYTHHSPRMALVRSNALTIISIEQSHWAFSTLHSIIYQHADIRKYSKHILPNSCMDETP